jgi:rhodanese-related sulfurtransferase
MLRVFCPIALLLASIPVGVSQTPAAQVVSSRTFATLREGVQLIDVREAREWEETGMPDGARGVSLSRDDFVHAVLAELGGDRSRPVAVICRSGARSAKAAEQLLAAGFTNVTNVGDGMIGRSSIGEGWLQSGLPMSKAPSQGR